MTKTEFTPTISKFDRVVDGVLVYGALASLLIGAIFSIAFFLTLALGLIIVFFGSRILDTYRLNVANQARLDELLRRL